MPVHRWALRHLYIPLVSMGYNKNIGSVAVFFVSAFFHEYMVSIYADYIAHRKRKIVLYLFFLFNHLSSIPVI